MLLDSLLTKDPDRLELEIRKFLLDLYANEKRDEDENKIYSIPLEDSVQVCVEVDNNKEHERGKQSGPTGADLIRMIFNPTNNGNSMKRRVDYSSDSSECENEDSKLPEKQPYGKTEPLPGL